MTKWLTPKQVADLFQVSTRTVTRWADAGRIPCTRTLAGQRRFKQSDIVKYLRIMDLDPEED